MFITETTLEAGLTSAKAAKVMKFASRFMEADVLLPRRLRRPVPNKIRSLPKHVSKNLHHARPDELTFSATA